VLPLGSHRPGTEPAERWTQRPDLVTAALRTRGLRLHFGGHTMMTWVGGDYFARHPEWFALVEGKRGGPDPTRNKPLCVTNVPMRRQLVRNMRKFLDENPAAEILDLWHPDSDQFCHCPRCLRGMPGDAGAEFVGMAYLRSFMEFAAAVVEDLQRTHPRVRVSPLVNYSESTNWPLPAGVDIPDGLLIGLAHFPPLRDSYLPLSGEPHSAGNARLLAIDLSWKAKARHTYIYEYYNAWYRPFLHPQVRYAARDLPLWRELGFTGLSNDMYGWSPVNLYAVTRLMWEPRRKPGDLIADFCRRYYGRAADRMNEYWTGLEDLIEGTLGYLSGEPALKKFKRARREQIAHLEATAAGAGDPVTRSRVERCLRPWRSLDDRDKARWWAVAAFESDDSKPD
jgi:hypothetical protein